MPGADLAAAAERNEIGARRLRRFIVLHLGETAFAKGIRALKRPRCAGPRSEGNVKLRPDTGCVVLCCCVRAPRAKLLH